MSSYSEPVLKDDEIFENIVNSLRYIYNQSVILDDYLDLHEALVRISNSSQYVNDSRIVAYILVFCYDEQGWSICLRSQLSSLIKCSFDKLSRFLLHGDDKNDKIGLRLLNLFKIICELLDEYCENWQEIRT